MRLRLHFLSCLSPSVRPAFASFRQTDRQTDIPSSPPCREPSTTSVQLIIAFDSTGWKKPTAPKILCEIVALHLHMTVFVVMEPSHL